MSAVHETAVALRLRGEDLDPHTITALLGAEPTLAARKNDTWYTPNGKAVVARQGFWHLETERLRPGDLNVQIASILGQLTDDLGVWRQLTSTYRADLFCGLFLSEANQGIEIEPETLVITGQRGLRLDFDIYRQD